MAFNNYLEEENDKPYFTTNSLAYYYDKMEGFAKAVEGSAKALNLTKEEIEQRIALRLAEWDKNLETFDGSVEKLLSEWVDDGTLTHVIDSALIDQKIAPVTAQLAEKADEKKLFDMVNVKEYDDLVIKDAQGNSVNWSPAFKAAFESGASKVVFPNWTMKYKEPIHVPSHIKEIDFAKADLIYEKEQSALSPTFLESGFIVINVDDLNIKGGKHTYSGTYDYGTSYKGVVSAIYIEQSDNVLIEKLEASGFNRAGINIATGENYTEYCENPKISKCNLHHNRVAGIVFGNTEGLEIEGSKLNYNGSPNDNGTGYGLAGWSSKQPKNTHVHHNQANYNHRKGIDFHSGENGIVDHNMCIGNKYYGIFVSGGNLKVMGDWQITQNQIKGMSNDGSIPGQSSYGIHVGSNQGTLTKPTKIILDGNIITGLNQINTGVVIPYILYVHGLSYGSIKILNSITDVENIERFITTNSNSDNPGNHSDVVIANSEFKAKKVNSTAFSLLSTTNRITDFSSNKVEILEDYTQNLLFAYASTVITGDVHTYNNNDLKVKNTIPWSYDPLQLKRTNKEKAIGNVQNGVPLRDWDGYKYKDVGTLPPTENYFVRGSLRENATPRTNNPVAWVCTVAGTPGTWEGYGNITTLIP